MSLRCACALIAALLVAACGSGARRIEVGRLDLGQLDAPWQAALPLASVVVQAPSWLDTTAIGYRLLYGPAHGANDRASYSESRWSARPAELIERALNRGLTASASGCRLSLELDELVQVFDRPQASRSRLAVRASLTTPSRDALLAHRSLLLEEVAPSADARGGVQAANANLQALGRELGAWLATSLRENPSLAARCGPT